MDKMFDEYLKATKEMQNMWEGRMAQMMDEFVKSQTFVTAMTKSLEASLDTRKVFEQAMNRWAEIFGVVTKKDVDTINRQMYDQNVRMEKMVELLTDIRDGLQTSDQCKQTSDHSKKAEASKAKKAHGAHA